jgi:2-methylcitrate dehydratase PrpD
MAQRREKRARDGGMKKETRAMSAEAAVHGETRGEHAGGAGATKRLAQHAANLRYEDLPAALVELIKQCVLDTLGVAIAATTLSPEANVVADYVEEMGGKAVATVWGFGHKAPAPWAVFVNGSLGHMVDYDDVGAGGHVSIVTIPVAFAVAERLGGVSGRDFLTAIAAGTDIHTRLNSGIRIPDWTIAEGWFPTQLFGFISGAATAAKLQGADAGVIENAFGIAFTQLSGSRQMAVGEATHLRSMQAGFSGQGAVLAADLAARGIVGSKEVLEGRYGLYKTYVRTDADWDAVLGGLGRVFPLLELHGFKVWPACGYTRPTNTAIRHMRDAFSLLPDEVEAITIIGGTGATRLLSEPLDLKRRPKLAIDAKFSIPFTSAVMMAKGNVTLRDYTEEGLRDTAVLAMADKVSYRVDPDGTLPVGGHSALSRPTVEIRMRDGRVHTCKPEGVPGDPNHPVSDELLEAKFRDCVSFSARPIPARNVERAIGLIRDLENLGDVTEIIRLLVPEKA